MAFWVGGCLSGRRARTLKVTLNDSGEEVTLQSNPGVCYSDLGRRSRTNGSRSSSRTT